MHSLNHYDVELLNYGCAIKSNSKQKPLAFLILKTHAMYIKNSFATYTPV